MMGFDFVPVTSIVVICCLIGKIIKESPVVDNWIPVVCGACGGIFGVIALFVMPGYPADDILTAIAIGIVSGLAATGAHQIGKQWSDG